MIKRFNFSRFIRCIKNSYQLFIMLFLGWLLLTLDFSYIEMLVGIVVCFFLAALTNYIYQPVSPVSRYFPGLIVLIPYLTRLIFEIYKSSFSMIIRIIRNDNEPAVSMVKLSISNPLSIALVANSITLTPGTITIDTDGSTLYVLAIKAMSEQDKSIVESSVRSFEAFFKRK